MDTVSKAACINILYLSDFLVELGEALRYNEAYIEERTQGIFRVMHHLGMIDEFPACYTGTPFISSSTVWLRARRGGLFHSAVELGRHVDKGQRLGKISDILGDSHGDLLAPRRGVIIGMVKKPHRLSRGCLDSSRLRHE